MDSRNILFIALIFLLACSADESSVEDLKQTSTASQMTLKAEKWHAMTVLILCIALNW